MTARATPSGLGGRRLELLERMLRDEGAALPAAQIPRRRRDGPAPMSFAQQRLWFLDRLSPANPFYNVQASIRHRGSLDAAALERAFNAVVERHEVLRTVFRLVGGEPVQVVLPRVEIALEHADLRRVPAGQREAEAIRLAVQERLRPYDLSEGPLARVKLVQLGDADRVVLLGLHHIVADGWSLGLLASELGAMYEHFARGREVRLPPLHVHYADFAVWQREWLSGTRLDEQLGYWRRQLADLPALALPNDRPRPAVQAHEGAGFAFELGEDVAAGLAAAARRHRATLFMALLAAWAAVLGRWCEQDDVVIGAPVAGRDRAELEPLIGFFVNTLVLRVDTSGDPAFGELIERVRDVALDAFAHSDVPFEKLVEDLAPQRDLSRNPLFQVTFQLFESPTAPDAVAASQQLDAPVTSSLFDLRVDVFRGPSGLSGRVEYDTALFDEQSLRWLIERFVFVCEQVARDPGQRLSELDWVPPAQRALLARFNATAAPVPHVSVPGRLARWADETPDRPAIADRGGAWTFAELDDRAARLAGALAGVGGARGDVVAVCLPRGREFVAAALAALRLGAAYLPLDVAYPPARLAHILADGRPAAVVTTAALAARLEPQAAVGAVTQPAPAPAVVTVDDWPRAAPVDPVAVAPDELAYVIYTSGSTGTPKGVEITHAGLLNLVGWHVRAYGLTPVDRGGQISSAGFDAAVWETWPQLYAGGALHVCDDETRGDVDALIAWLRDEAIAVCFIPTPLAELVLERRWPADAPLRFLLTGGDTLRRAANAQHPYTLVNHYGPTESSVVATACVVGEDEALPPIGAPIANTTAYVVDGHGSLAGPGQPGELLLGGAGLARGYCGDPDLTRERFVLHPFAPGGGRLYRTGDRVRWRPDGRLAFLGRTDSQIKIRGHRIEPREIETLLATHPHVTQAVVTAAPQLTAHVTVDGAADDQVAHWRRLYEQTYSDGAPADPEFDIRGWNRSSDGAPLGEAVMREQVDQTVERIAALAPKRILEIGCGTGLLLFRLAANAERYCATDFSPAALERLGGVVRARGWSHVQLLERSADELGDLAGAGFDVVVLNSVAQYFPDAGCLRRVLLGALECLRPGGAVFVGDVRNHALLEAFHTSVELEAAAADLPAAELRRRIRRRIETEQELLLDPGWFSRFAEEAPHALGVTAAPRRGRHDTELTRFRYDVVLARDAAPKDPPATVLDWDAERLDPGQLPARLEHHGVLVRGIPSTRLQGVLAAMVALESAGDSATAGSLRREAAAGGVDPEDLWRLPGVAIGWHGSGATGRYDACTCALPPPPVSDGPLSNDPARHDRRIAADLRRWLQERLPEAMVPSTIVVLDALPVTPHGKVDRDALPAADAAAERPHAPALPAASETERRLADVWAATLGLDAVGAEENFFELGGDSILSIKLATRAAEAGIFFSTKDLFQHQTVRELARVVSSTRRVQAEQGPVRGPVPLTPIQRWFFEQNLAEPHHFNQAASIAVPPGVNAELLVRALRAVVDHHDALHLRFSASGGEWSQRCQPSGAPLSVVAADLSAVAPESVPEAVDRAGRRLETSLRLDGPLIRVGLLTHGPGRRRRLLVVIHHLAVDGVSWRILIEDLWKAYEALTKGLPAVLPPKTTSFKAWAERLVERAAAPELATDADYWLGVLPPGLQRLPRDLPGDDNRVAVTRSVRVRLDRGETEALARLPGRRAVHEVLVFAAVRALARWTGWSEVPLAVEGHGREAPFEDIDVSRTVGWFTSIYPLVVPASADLGAVAEQLAAVPERGFGYGLLRYLSPDAELRARLAAAPWPEISFNYLGRLDDAPADPLAERTGPVRSPAAARAHLLELNGAITGGQLQFDVFYSCAIHTEATARALADGFAAELRDVIAGADGAVVGDGVSARDVETVLARVARREES